MEGIHPALALAIALAVGVLAQSVARHLRVPGIVLLLIAGATLGPDGLGWVRPRDFGDGLHVIVDLAVAVILFEGGLNLEISRLRREQASIRRLVTWGALITLGGGAVAAWALLDWTVPQALLFASLIVVTVALHTLEREEALAELAELGWVVVEASTLAPAEAAM